MPTSKQKISIAAILSTLLLLSFFNCQYQEHRNPDVLQCVPASAPIVVQADLASVLKMARCQSKGGVIAYTPELMRAMQRIFPYNTIVSLEEIGAQGDWLDLSQCLIFTENNCTSLIAVLPIKEEADMPQHLRRHTTSTWGEVKVSSLSNGLECMLTSSHGWIFDGNEFNVGRLDSLAISSLGHSIGDNQAMTDAINASGMCKGILRLSSFTNPLGNNFNALAWKLELTDRRIHASAWCIDGDSVVDATCLLRTLSPTDTLALPVAPTLAIGMALNDKAIDKIISTTKIKSLAMRLAFQAFAKRLEPDSSAIMCAVAPGGSAETLKQFNLNNWICQASVPLYSHIATIDSIIATHPQLQSLNTQAIANGLRITNYDFDLDDANHIWPQYRDDGAQAIFAFSVPYKSEVMKALKIRNGYEGQAIVINGKTDLHLQLLGPSHHILPQLINDFNNLINKK